MTESIKKYNDSLTIRDREICESIAKEFDNLLSESENKIWHGHPVWFIDGNPIVGYSKLKNEIQLLFWSGQSFEEECLKSIGKFKAAEVRFTNLEQINTIGLKSLLEKSKLIQWDYKNIIQRKGELIRLK